MAPAVAGQLTPRQAVERLLAGSGLVAVTDGAAVVVRSAAAPGAAAATLPAVVVEAGAERETATGPVQGYVARRSASGTKTDTPIMETPQSISVVTADRISALGVTNLKDALGYTPGVGTTTYGADSRYDWINLRGFDAYSPGFYLDGLPLRNNGNWGIWRTENYGAERIEVLRGPASVMYGQSGPGGVVNVVSKRPTTEPIRELQLQLGDHRRKQVAGDFAGALNDDGSLSYRLTGVLRDGELPAGGMRDDRSYLAPSLTWKSRDTTVTLLSQISRTRAGVYTRAFPTEGSLVPTAIGTRIPSGLFVGDPKFNHFDVDQSMIGYQLEHRIDSTWTLRQNARYGHLKVDYGAVGRRGFVTLDEDDANDPINFTQLRRTSSGSIETVRSFNLDNQVQADLRVGDWTHKILVGVDYQRTTIDQFSYGGGRATPLNIYAPVHRGPVEIPDPNFDGITKLKQTGFYMQDQIKWKDRWAFTLSGRYDRAESTVDSRLDNSRARVSDGKFTSRVGLVYLHPSGLAPYLSYTQSFTPSGVVDPATNRPFKPETGRQYEAGLRYQPTGGKQSYSVAVFDLRRQNYITFNEDSVPKQTGEVTVRGLEFEAIAEIMPRLNVTAAYSYTPKAAVTRSSLPSEIGLPLMAVPRNRLAVWADYRFSNGLKIGAGARFIGANYGDGGTTPAKVPSVTIYDAMIGYDFARWSLALNLRNVANKTYFANCDSFTCYYGDQRSVLGTATYRW
ncbi:ligand-gated channel protein [Variovorax paradoxus]|nr:ligand-gated channel protein [Variovorax paradoxus]KPV05797.1 ligand-gated channel protein [Variovorax paradoxus]KPV31553.1 ligand-gated channel protein [Variovorax paradoxus]